MLLLQITFIAFEPIDFEILCVYAWEQIVCYWNQTVVKVPNISELWKCQLKQFLCKMEPLRTLALSVVDVLKKHFAEKRVTNLNVLLTN